MSVYRRMEEVVYGMLNYSLNIWLLAFTFFYVFILEFHKPLSCIRFIFSSGGLSLHTLRVSERRRDEEEEGEQYMLNEMDCMKLKMVLSLYQ